MSSIPKTEAYAREKLVCMRCRAVPGEYCKTLTGLRPGSRSDRVHADRFYRARDQIMSNCGWK